MLTSQMIKEAALAAGADMCGIGSMDRFEGAPREMDPRFIFPEAKSVIGMVFRIPRGVQRGIEEGTQFYQYPSMAYGGINEIFAPSVDAPNGGRHCVCLFYKFKRRSIGEDDSMHIVSVLPGFSYHNSHISPHTIDFYWPSKSYRVIPAHFVVYISVNFYTSAQDSRHSRKRFNGSIIFDVV